MNRYNEMKARHQQTFSEWTPGKMFFAFSKGQLADGMRELGLDPEKDFSEICALPAGGFCRKESAKEFKAMFAGFDKELHDAIEADQTGEGFIYDMFYSELTNHELSYTGRAEDALEALGIDPAELDNNKALAHGLALAMQDADRSED